MIVLAYSGGEVIFKFADNIHNQYYLNIVKYPTTSSLATAIFRAHYIGDTKIIVLSGDMAIDIRKSYTGGAVDMYIPYGENVHCYDVILYIQV